MRAAALLVTATGLQRRGGGRGELDEAAALLSLSATAHRGRRGLTRARAQVLAARGEKALGERWGSVLHGRIFSPWLDAASRERAREMGSGAAGGGIERRVAALREETRERDAGRWGSGAGGARWATREKGGSSDALPAARVRGGGWASRGKWAGLDGRA